MEIFLQGSYANHTNIRADSDVDIVVMTQQAFVGSRERLVGQALYRFDSYPSSSYSAFDLKQEVLDILTPFYGADRVHRKNKCIRVDAGPGYVDADVVPSLEYRLYPSGSPNIDRDYIPGIQIVPDRGGVIVNYPKRHIRNGELKNGRCWNRYKPTVRQVKRLRNRARDLGLLPDGVAPGYLLECMVYNVPDDKFIASDTDRLSGVVLWLKYATKSSFVSCDEVHQLFHTDPGRFDVGAAQQVIDALWAAF